MHSMLVAERRTRHDAFMDTDGALHLAATSIKIAQREMCFDRVVVDISHPQENFQRLVGLLIEQETQAAKVFLGQFVSWSDGSSTIARTITTEQPTGGRGNKQRDDQQ